MNEMEKYGREKVVGEVHTRKCAELTLKLDKNPDFKTQGLTLPYGMDIDILIPYFVLHAGPR